MKGYQIDLPEKITCEKPSLIRVNETLEKFREILTEKYSSTKFFWSTFSNIQSEYRKLRTEKTLYLDPFHTVKSTKISQPALPAQS